MHIAVIIPYHPQARHDTLFWTLDGLSRQTLDADQTLEVLVGVDGDGESSADLPEIPTSPHTIRILRLPRQGAAAVRNALVQRVQTTPDLLIFINADTRPDPDLVQHHARTLAGLPAKSLVLGAAPWERKNPTVLDTLIDERPMIFSYCHLRERQGYSFRVAYSLNLSVRREDFVVCGGFPERIRPYYYEDLAFGCRVLGPQRKGLFYHPEARVLHRHPMTWDQYLDREELLGLMAPVLARACPEAFAVLMNGRAVDQIAHDFHEKLQGHHGVYRSLYQRLREQLSQPAATLGEGASRQRTLDRLFQLHLPVKLLAFRLGFLRGLQLADDQHWQTRKSASLWRECIER